MRLQDSLNFLLGQYVSIGVNNPKKYPSAPLLSEERENKELPADDNALLRLANTLGAEINGGNS